MAPISAHRKNDSLPANSVGMPISRAPRRLIAVARSALPYTVRSNNTLNATINSNEQPITHNDCALAVSVPIVTVPSENAGVREPSAPNTSKPSPTITTCTATETISSINTDASASG